MKQAGAGAPSTKSWFDLFRYNFLLPGYQSKGIGMGILRTRPTLLFIVTFLAVPNAIFLLAVLSGIGTPARSIAIVGYVMVGLLARNSPMWIAVTTYLAVLTFDLINTFSLLFGLSFVEILVAIRFAQEVHLFDSPLYGAIAVLIALGTGLALRLLVQEREGLRRARPLPALLLALGIVTLDFGTNTSSHYHFGSAFAGTRPLESAINSSGLKRSLSGSESRNMLLVIVEGLGVFADSNLQALVMAPMDNIQLRNRYEILFGQTSYFGSTTAAEMRELCATRESYVKYLTSSAADCLPAILAEKGYRTVALHGFSKRMFDRDLWYPNIGFQEIHFGEELLAARMPHCGKVFIGACDVAIAGQIGQMMVEAKQPYFFYWLTLNTHIPVPPGGHRNTIRCSNGGGLFGNTEVCDMAGMWVDVLDEIARLALRTDLPPTDILIVGDHAPPLWSRKQRNLFQPGSVAWIRLAWKDGALDAKREQLP